MNTNKKSEYNYKEHSIPYRIIRSIIKFPSDFANDRKIEGGKLELVVAIIVSIILIILIGWYISVEISLTGAPVGNVIN